MSIGDSNVVDGADVNPPSADAGPDPCVSNHDVVPVVPVVPDVPVSTEAMMPCTARRGIMEIPDRPTLRLQPLVVDPLNQCTASNRIKEYTWPNMAFHPFLFTSTPVTTPVTYTFTTRVTFSAW